MKRASLLYFSLTVVVLLASVLLAQIRSKHRLISDVEVEFKGDGAGFLNEEIVNKLLIQSKDSMYFQEKDMLALNKVEQSFLSHPVIKNAELYTVPQGKLYIEIEERKPVVRVLAATSYYLDAAANKIPLSQRHTAQVPLFYGELNKENMHALVHLISKLSSDAFLADEVIDFQWQDNAFVLGLRSFPFDVIWGGDDGFSQKAEKLKRFCAYTLENNNQTFNRINLTYNKQVVARHNEGYEKQ